MASIVLATGVSVVLLILGFWQGYRIGRGEGIEGERAAWRRALKERAELARMHAPLCSSCEGIWRKALVEAVEALTTDSEERGPL